MTTSHIPQGILFVGAAAFGDLAGAEAQDGVSRRPNILFCIADDASWLHFGAYGCKWVSTPVFDSVAARGVLFENCYTPNAKSAPSRASLLTGRYSWQLGEAGNHICRFPENIKVFTEALEETGYDVAFTGKGWAPGDPGMKDGCRRQLTGKAWQNRKLTPPTSEILATDYDKTWFFLLAAEYAKGPAEADVVRAMPTKAIPYFISSETAAVDQPVTFEFNRTAYADASDVTWTFPDGTVLTGDKVLSGFKTTGNQTVMLSAKIDGSSREWKITVEIRPYVVNFMDWEQADGAKYESPTYTCPVLSPDAGTVYVNTGNKVSNLYAFDVRTGKNKWTFRPTDNGDMQAESKSMVAVNPVSGDIYYGTSAGGQFYAVKPDGTLHWKFSKCGSMNSAPPAVSADGTVVYIADAKGDLYALDAETGTERWSAPYAAGSCGYGLLVNGGEVVLGTKTAIHFVNAADGTKIEAVSVSIVNSIGFAVSPDRKKAYFAYATTLAAVDLDSHTLYARSAAGGDNYYQPIVAGDGTVFAGTKDGYVRFFSSDLQTMIHEEQPSSVKKNTFNFTRPLVDANNRFYIMASGNSTEDSLVLEYDTSGNKISDWSYTQNNCQNGCNLADGVLYTVNQGSGDGGNGLFIGKYIGAARGRGWSSHGGDHCGSGCIQSPLIEW